MHESIFSPLYYRNVHKCKCNSFFHFLRVNKRHKDGTLDTSISLKVVRTITANIHSFNGHYFMHFTYHHISLNYQRFIHIVFVSTCDKVDQMQWNEFEFASKKWGLYYMSWKLVTHFHLQLEWLKNNSFPYHRVQMEC